MTLAQERDFWTQCTAHTTPYIFYDDTEYRLLMGLLVENPTGTSGTGNGLWCWGLDV